MFRNAPHVGRTAANPYRAEAESATRARPEIVTTAGLNCRRSVLRIKNPAKTRDAVMSAAKWLIKR